MARLHELGDVFEARQRNPVVITATYYGVAAQLDYMQEQATRLLSQIRAISIAQLTRSPDSQELQEKGCATLERLLEHHSHLAERVTMLLDEAYFREERLAYTAITQCS